MSGSAVYDRLREAVRHRADTLDGGIFAPPWVLALGDDEQIAAWETVIHDSEVLAAHRPQADPVGGHLHCASEGQRFPCAAIARLAATYGV